MLNWRERLLRRMLIFGDMIRILIGFLVVDFITHGIIGDDIRHSLINSMGIAVFFVFNNLLIFRVFGIYDHLMNTRGAITLRLMLHITALPILATGLTKVEMTLLDESLTQSEYIVYTVMIIIVLMLSRVVIYLLFQRMKTENILIVGYSSIGEQYIEEIAKKRYLNVEIIGYIGGGEENEGWYENIPRLGDLKDWEYVAHTYVVDQITMVPHLFLSGRLSEYISKFENRGIVFNVLLDIIDTNLYHASEEMVGPLTSVKIHTVSLDEAQLFYKRTLDIIVGTLGVCLFALLYIIVGPLIKLDSKGPILFKQERVGLNGRIFEIWKFRTMVVDAEARKASLASKNKMSRNMFKVDDDPRITRLGKFIRKTSIDEFPQFINVLKGDMSVVGTRPPTMDEVAQYTNEEHRRISVFPGITGIWQVSGRSDLTDFDEILRIEEEYITNWSIWLDLKILLKTIKVVILCEGSE